MKAQYDLEPLNRFVRGLSFKHVVRVGIFGNKANRNKDKGMTNPELGAIHEFGSFSRGIPQRSFLRMPVHQDAAKIVNETGASALTFMNQGKIPRVLRNLGIACENAIQRAFAARGPGWQANKPSTVKAKGSDAPLIDTGQLRRSITSKVEAK